MNIESVNLRSDMTAPPNKKVSPRVKTRGLFSILLRNFKNGKFKSIKHVAYNIEDVK